MYIYHLRSKETTGLYTTYSPDHKAITSYRCVVKATHDTTLACIGLIALKFRHDTKSFNCIYRRPSRFRLWDLVLVLCIQPLNYSARCLKQFLKVSTELLNIFVTLEKVYQEPEYLTGSIKTTQTHNCIFRRCINVVLQVRCHVNFVLKVSKYLMCTST